MAFDPNKPFVVVGRPAAAPSFDPAKPFAVVKEAAPAAKVRTPDVGLPAADPSGAALTPASMPSLGSFFRGLGGGLAAPFLGAAQIANKILPIGGSGPLVSRRAPKVPMPDAGTLRKIEGNGPLAGLGDVVGSLVNPLYYAAPEVAGSPLLGSVLGGAVGAALQPTSNRGFIANKAEQLAAGGLAGAALHGFGAAIARPLRANAQELVDQGVRLTPGAQLGRPGRELADVVSKAPLVGDVVASGNRRMIDDFNRAMYDQALAPLGERITGPERGNAGMAAMRDKIDAAYTKALRGLSFRASEPFMDELNGIRRELPPRSRAVFDEVVRDRMPWLYSNGPAMKRLTGDELSAEVSYLRKAGRSLRGINAAPEQQDAGDALRLMVRALGDNATEMEPGAKALKANADNAYARYLILKRAAGGATAEGRFTPTDVLKASKALAEFDRAFVEGRANMQPAAQRALSVIGNPPLEAGRSIWGAGMDIGGALAALHDPAAAAYAAGVLGPALAAHTEPGMNALRRLTISPTRGAIGRSLLDAIPLAGAATGRAVQP